MVTHLAILLRFGSLYPPTLMDENVGVTDIGSVSFMDRSRFIALCSDYTIRVFDGVNWGYDRAKQLVSSEIRNKLLLDQQLFIIQMVITYYGIKMILAFLSLTKHLDLDSLRMLVLGGVLILGTTGFLHLLDKV